MAKQILERPLDELHQKLSMIWSSPLFRRMCSSVIGFLFCRRSELDGADPAIQSPDEFLTRDGTTHPWSYQIFSKHSCVSSSEDQNF
jgi:hypothetical protein